MYKLKRNDIGSAQIQITLTSTATFEMRVRTGKSISVVSPNADKGELHDLPLQRIDGLALLDLSIHPALHIRLALSDNHLLDVRMNPDLHRLSDGLWRIYEQTYFMGDSPI